MRDIRGNILKDGDLVLKIVDGGNFSNELVYCVIINNRPFYKNPFITTYAKTKSRQLVKIDNLTEKEKEIRKDLLMVLTEIGGKKMIGVKTNEVAEIADELVNNYIESVSNDFKEGYCDGYGQAIENVRYNLVEYLKENQNISDKKINEICDFCSKVDENYINQ